MDDFRETAKSWAYDNTDESRVQDLELAINALGIDDLLLEFASDDDCPKQTICLSCLYFFVGDVVLNQGKGTTFEELEILLFLGREKTHPFIKMWIQRSRHLLAHLEEFDYNLWCSGGFAYNAPL
jgi:hypothetical protein